MCLCKTRLIDLMEVEPTWFARTAMLGFSARVLTLNVAAGVHSASEALIQQPYIISLIVVIISIIKGARNFCVRICDKKKHRAKAKFFFDLCGCLMWKVNWNFFELGKPGRHLQFPVHLRIPLIFTDF